MGQGHLLFCTGCGENYWSAMGRMQPGEPCRLCGSELGLNRRADALEPPAPDDRRGRPTIQAAT